MVSFGFRIRVSHKQFMRRPQDSLDFIDEVLKVVLVECHDHEQHLNVHLDDRLADQGGTEERPERNQKVTTRETSEIKQWVRNLEERMESVSVSARELNCHLQAYRCTGQNAQEANPFDQRLNRLLDRIPSGLLVFQLFFVFQLLAGQSSGSGHKVGRQFADRCARTPHERLQSNFGDDLENGDHEVAGLIIRTDDSE